MIRILVSGSRRFADRWAFHRAMVDELTARGQWDEAAERPTGEVVIVHGDAKGLDTIAREWAEFYGVPHEPHPADWVRWGASAGPRRNAEMVALGADVMHAWPIGESRGTRGCILLAEKAGIPAVVHEATELATRRAAASARRPRPSVRGL